MKHIENIKFPISSFKHGLMVLLRDGREKRINGVEYLCGKHYFTAMNESEDKLYPLEWVVEI